MKTKGSSEKIHFFRKGIRTGVKSDGCLEKHHGVSGKTLWPFSKIIAMFLGEAVAF